MNSYSTFYLKKTQTDWALFVIIFSFVNKQSKKRTPKQKHCCNLVTTAKGVGGNESIKSQRIGLFDKYLEPYFCLFIIWRLFCIFFVPPFKMVYFRIELSNCTEMKLTEIFGCTRKFHEIVSITSVGVFESIIRKIFIKIACKINKLLERQSKWPEKWNNNSANIR